MGAIQLILSEVFQRWLMENETVAPSVETICKAPEGNAILSAVVTEKSQLPNTVASMAAVVVDNKAPTLPVVVVSGSTSVSVSPLDSQQGTSKL
eukprot:Nitzschia sp. Nitz4//scaffold140_size61219//57896//61250//NITZ4_006443-RA/size61219-exonerate_est2genome-gene-0.30-mRNA-1//-1//CDS//3329536236//2926//frame0